MDGDTSWFQKNQIKERSCRMAPQDKKTDENFQLKLDVGLIKKDIEDLKTVDKEIKQEITEIKNCIRTFIRLYLF